MPKTKGRSSKEESPGRRADSSTRKKRSRSKRKRSHHDGKRSRSRGKRSRSRGRRSESSGRPPTRRNVKDLPKKDECLCSSENFIKSERLDLICASAEHHEYLQFSLKITEDIIKNDLYTNDQIQQVINSHFEANKSRLDKDKMERAIVDLCKELNISPLQCCHSGKSRCICPEENLKSSIVYCECATKRPPPLPCLFHTLQSNKPGSKASVSNKGSANVEVIQSPKLMRDVSETDGSKMNADVDPDADDIDHQTDDERMGTKGIQTWASQSSGNQTGYDDMSEAKDEPEYSQPKEVKNVERRRKPCMCGSPSCDVLTCKQDGSEESLLEEEPAQELEYVEVFPDSDTELPEEYHPSSSKAVLVDDLNEKIETEPKEPVVAEPEPPVEEVTKSTGCGCNDDMFATFLKYYEEHMNRPKNMHELEVAHYTTSIEPTTVQTTDFCAQTSVHFMMPEEPPRFAEFAEPKVVEKCPAKNNGDYVLFQGPVLIPRETFRKSVEMPSQSDFASSRCACNCSVGTEPEIKRKTPTPVRFDCEAYRTVLYPRKPPSQQRNYDCDLTPQRDTLLFADDGKYLNVQCGCDNEQRNLLYSARYNRFPPTKENLSEFYPTIATQVSSMEFMRTQQPSRSHKDDPNSASEKQSFALSKKVSIASTKYETTVTQQQQQQPERKPSKKTDEATTPDEKPPKKTEDVSKGDSLEKRIEMMKLDMDRYKDEEVQSTISMDESISTNRDKRPFVEAQTTARPDRYTSSMKQKTADDRFSITSALQERIVSITR